MRTPSSPTAHPAGAHPAPPESARHATGARTTARASNPSATTTRTRARRSFARLLALAVVAALAVVLPAQQTGASTLQQLTVRTAGIPTGTEVALFRLDRTGTYLGWQESASTDAAGNVAFATVHGQTYTLWTAETATTFPQYLGGGVSLADADRFTTPDAENTERHLDVTTAPLVTGTITWPSAGTPAYGEVNLHAWDATAKAWTLTSYAPIDDLTATGGTFAVKAPAGVPVAVSAQVGRTDGSTASGWYGGAARAPQSHAAATTVTATRQTPVTGLVLRLSDVAPATPAPGTTPAPTPLPTRPSPTTKPSHKPTVTPARKPTTRPTTPRSAPTVSARISGTPKVGARLTATGAPQGWTASYTWKRDGRTIARANARAYRPTTPDAGRRLTVTVALRRAGHTPAATTSKAVRVAKIAGKVRVSAAKRSVRVTVKTPGVAAPTGKVTVKVGSRSRTYNLKTRHRGVLTVKASPGRAKVRVTYRGNARVATAKTTKTVRVR